jgi:hypothetical protein
VDRSPADVGDADRAGRATVRDPSAREEGVKQGGAGGAGEVVSALCPVGAASRDWTIGGANALDIDSKVGEQCVAGRGDGEVMVGAVQVPMRTASSPGWGS